MFSFPIRTRSSISLLLLAALLAGCQSRPREVSLEIEDFQSIQHARIIDTPDASGGKAVQFDQANAQAATTVRLPKGAYRMIAYMQGVNPDHDSVWVEMGDQRDYMWVGSYGQIGQSAKHAEFLAPGGRVTVRVLMKESRVLVDRVVLTPIPDEVVSLRLQLEPRKDLPFDFQPYCFTGAKLPVGDFGRPLQARKLLGDYTLHFRYFDAQHNEVQEAAAPGRYGAVAEIHLPDGRVSRRFRTLYRMPADVPWWKTDLHASIALPDGLGIDPAVARAQRDTINDGLKSYLALALERDREAAILFAGLSEMSAGDPPVNDYTAPMARDRQWWVTLKRKLYSYDRKYTRPLAPPRKIDGAPAAVVREGSLEEAGLTPEAVRNIDEICKAWAADSDEAFAVCIVRNGVIALHKAYGRRGGKPMTVDTPSWMASITKLIAGTLFTRFVDQGLVDPDAKVSAYLQPLRGRKTRRPLLVRHCYTHTSGLWGHFGAEEHDLEEQVADWAPYLPVGYQYDYNGTGLDLGGKVLEAVSGQSLPQLYRRQLLEPLGMDNTFVTDSGGGARSTPLDMAKLGQMLLNRGAYGDRRFFDEDAFQQFLPHPLTREIGPENDTVYGFGCSWYEGEGLGEGTFGHGAASSAIFRVSPKHRLVLVMCRNYAGENYGKYETPFMAAVAKAVTGASD